ncbi:Histidinol-phosphate aminotransferase [compost metagenome]
MKNCFNSYTLDRVALAGAEQSLRDIDTFKTNVNRIIQTREHITSKLRALGFYVVDSKANFIFISHSEVPAETIFEKLKQRNIFVRYFKKSEIDNYLRVSIGTDHEMSVFYQGVVEILEEYAWK